MSISPSEAFTLSNIDKRDALMEADDDLDLSKHLDVLLLESGYDREGEAYSDLHTMLYLCFVAGRCYQTQFSSPSTVEIPMTTETLRLFIQFLTT